MDKELKSCPFCGSEDVNTFEEDDEIREWYVICNECWAQGARSLTETSAISLWNLRNKK
jgi:Lar family restriction alleviation protein